MVFTVLYSFARINRTGESHSRSYIGHIDPFLARDSIIFNGINDDVGVDIVVGNVHVFWHAAIGVRYVSFLHDMLGHIGLIGTKNVQRHTIEVESGNFQIPHQNYDMEQTIGEGKILRRLFTNCHRIERNSSS